MTGSGRRAAAIVATALTALVGATWAAPGAAAADLPYTDGAVNGSVGLCDAAGRPLTRGNINDKPFVWRAVSSTPAPAPFNGSGRKATLLAYQPRAGTDPEMWSGDILTASSIYTNPRYPMAQATALDFSLKDFLLAFPPQLDGLIQLRIYLGAPDQGALSSTYPATDIRISGNTWTVARGASVICTAGSAKSTETVSAPVTGKSPGAKAPPTSKSGAPTPTASSETAGGAGLKPTGGSADPGGGSSSTAPILLWGLGVLGVLTGMGAYWWRRQRSA